MSRTLPIFLLVACGLPFVFSADEGLPAGVKSTQNPKDVPPTPTESVKLFQAPKGFEVALFAGEPDVAQPIAMCFDDRGRLWVAECYTYPKWHPAGEAGLDRILIFEDTDGDGRFDKRKVFLDKLPNLTSIVIGHGGVWALCAPNLLFIPDRNSDDVPDEKPTVVLDGFTLRAGHNIVNGLMWGPDGWLYGRHGITWESLVGKPGSPDGQRTRLNCSIWRFHPIRQTFEVVCNGTTNPWGCDFDDHGEAFFTNCVIAHLWHAVPGAHFKRMYGQDYNRFTYELIDACSDHLHWGGGDWQSSRTGTQVHNEAGGGHAHCGGMIYLGDNWPDDYRNAMFTCNTHGTRLNCDYLQRQGCGYVGKHGPDMLFVDSPWFRGVALDYGPDGSVFVADWCDLGECHDHDGVHRTSGRIYRVAYGKPKPLGAFDLAKKTDAELVQLQLHKNDWFVRHGRRLLTERAVAGKPMADVHTALLKIFENNPDVTRKLRALWALHVTGGAKPDWLLKQLDHQNEHVRSWTVRLLVEERKPTAEALAKFQQLAEFEPSGLVRLYLASALQRLPASERLPIAARLAGRAEDAQDRCQPLMIWYGIEPVVLAERSAAVQLAVQSKIPKLRQFIARRLLEADDAGAGSLNLFVEVLGKVPDAASQRDLLHGIREGLRGRKSLPAPRGWAMLQDKLIDSPNAEVRDAGQWLAVLFDDPKALALVRKRVTEAKASAEERSAALQVLVEKGAGELKPLLFDLLNDKALRAPAIRALAAFSHEETPEKLLKLYPMLNAAEKQDTITTLSARPKYALALLDAIDRKAIPRTEVSAFTARQLDEMHDAQVTAKLTKVWGQIRQTSQEKKALFAKYQGLLTGGALAQADPSSGRAVFNRTCAQCHKLYGQGGEVGPDLTGSNRSDLHYILENAIDPSAIIGQEYRLTNIVTKDGRLVAGIVVEETDRAVTLRSATERVVVAKGDIDERRIVAVSMMPEGILESLKEDEVRDLVSYLRTKGQVPLPK
jgi:putative membrane-bound dehydrogenase-like protein